MRLRIYTMPFALLFALVLLCVAVEGVLSYKWFPLPILLAFAFDLSMSALVLWRLRKRGIAPNK